MLKISSPEHKPNYANLEYLNPNSIQMYATQFSRNFQNTQHGLPGKIGRLKIIASFTTKLCTAFTYNLLHQLRIRNCSNNVRRRCVLNAYFIRTGSICPLSLSLSSGIRWFSLPSKSLLYRVSFLLFRWGFGWFNQVSFRFSVYFAHQAF